MNPSIDLADARFKDVAVQNGSLLLVVFQQPSSLFDDRQLLSETRIRVLVETFDDVGAKCRADR